MKKIILRFERNTSNFGQLLDDSLNKGFKNFLISRDTRFAFECVQDAEIYAFDDEIPANCLILDDPSQLKAKITEINGLKKKIGIKVEIESKKDEEKIINLVNSFPIDFIIATAKDWVVIPFENLIAKLSSKNTKLIAEVENVEQAELLLNVLELGVDGILIEPKNLSDIAKLKSLIQFTQNFQLTLAEIVKIQQIKEGERVCVDTTSLLNEGEGMLIGSTAKGFVLVHAEVFETKFVTSRPFRVNAGDVSSYILVPSETEKYQTRYLSELSGGDDVFIVNTKGRARIVTIGRVKIETRPMIRFELRAIKDGNPIKFSCVCQNAETIRLINEKEEAVSVMNLQVGDKILVHLGPGATHFGTVIKEKIIEK